MLSALQLLKNQVKSARDTFESTVADVTPGQLQNNPGGKAFPLGATYAHLIFSEDAIIQGMLQGKQPLYTGDWKDKTGASKSIAKMDENWSKNNEEWSHSVQIDLPKLRKYSRAVHKATDTYMESLKDDDVEKEINLGSWGKKTLHDLLTGFVIGHTYSLTGEIAVLKGIQGAKGYPF